MEKSVLQQTSDPNRTLLLGEGKTRVILDPGSSLVDSLAKVQQLYGKEIRVGTREILGEDTREAGHAAY